MRPSADNRQPSTRKPRSSDTLSSSQARRIALRAQGFGEPRSEAEATKRDLRRMIERLAVLQIDSVNVLARAHLLPSFSRLGRYRPEDLHALAYGGRADPIVGDRLILTPHAAWSRPESVSDARRLAVETAMLYLREGRLRNLVNAPPKTRLRGVA